MKTCFTITVQRSLLLSVCLLTLLASHTLFAQTTVIGVIPANNALNVSPATTIQVTFSEAMLPASFNDMTSFVVRGITSGRHLGTFGFGGGNTIATFTPTVPFMKGERVVVDISSNLQNASSVAITPFVYSFTVGVNSSAGTLAAKVDYTTGLEPLSVFIGDVDNDGDGDLATANFTSNTVSILKNNGNGTFAAKVDYAAGGEPYSVFISDVDNDGDGDLAVANFTANNVSILKNNGDGTYAAAVNYTTGTWCIAVFIHDVDGDGDGDLAVLNYSSWTVSILKNNGNGTFAAKVDYPTGTQPLSIFISDVDSDGDGDIAVANGGSGSISILKNNGNGTFAAKVDYASGGNPSSVSISDLDGDGDGDLAVGNGAFLSTTVSILKNNGDGTFAAFVSYPANLQSNSIFVSDMDGDSDGDLVVASSAGPLVSIFKNNGDGTYAAKVDYAGVSNSFSLFVSDVDGDGDGDVAMTSSGSNSVSILKGNASPTNPSVAGAANPSTVTAGNSTLLTGTVTPGTVPTSTGLAVTGDLSSIGGLINQQFYDNATNGDVTSGDNIFSFSATVAPATTAGMKTLPLTVSDAQARMGTGSIILTVTAPTFTITAVAEVNGSISPDGNVVVTSGSNQAFMISANTGNHIDSVVVDGVNQGPITDYEFLNVTTNHIIDAYFSINEYTLTVNIVGNGSVTKSPDQATYLDGSTVQLDPTPALGYVFSGWSGSAGGTDDPLDLLMDGDKDVTATFAVHPVYETMYRTATYNDWATAFDGKGKYKAVKRKSDKVLLKFNIGAPASATGFTLKFSMAVGGAVTIGKDKSIQLGDSILNVKSAAFTGLTIAEGDTFQFDGWGAKGKQSAVKVVWDTSPKPISQTITGFKFNDPKLPIPNYHNVGEELFPAGFGQSSPYFNGGLLVGVPQGVKGARSVLHPKYSDVKKSLVKFSGGFPRYHADSIRCLDTFTITRKPIAKQQKNLPPDKGTNILFAELLTLKLNVAASATDKFPTGLGELTFYDKSDPSNPFNGQLVSEIAQKADTIISCLPLYSKGTPPTLGELLGVLQMINGAFVGTIDTFSFAAKTRLTGVRQLLDIPFLRKTPGIEPVIVHSNDFISEAYPEQIELRQNYPNPFNPTTTISFSLTHNAIVSLTVYTVLGEEVAVLFANEVYDEGEYDIDFDAAGLPSGVYIYRLSGRSLDDDGIAGSFNEIKKMLLIR